MGLLNVVDANGAPQLVSVPQPGTAVDASGVITANLPSGAGPFTYQQLLPAIVAPTRGGWFIRNKGVGQMRLSEDGTDPSTSSTAVTVFPGEVFPPPGVGYPITQGAIYLSGTPGDLFSCKVW